MTLTAILGAIAALGTIVGGIVYMFKYVANKTEKTLDQKQQDIDAKVEAEESQVANGGRPTWEK